MNATPNLPPKRVPLAVRPGTTRGTATAPGRTASSDRDVDRLLEYARGELDAMEGE